MSFPRALMRSTLVCLFLAVSFAAISPTLAGYMCGNFGLVFARANTTIGAPLLNAAVILNPDRTEPYTFLSEIYSKDGDNDGAVQALTDGLTKNPDNSDLLVARATLRHTMKDDRLALADIDKAISNSGKVPKYLLERGRIYTALGDLGRAKSDFSSAISLWTGSSSVSLKQLFSLRGLTYFGQGDYREAINDFSSALEEGSEDVALNYVRRALAYRAIGDNAMATKNFEAVIRTVYPVDNDGEHQLLLAFAAKQTGNKDLYESSLTQAKDKKVSRDKLKQIVLGDLPLVTLSW